MTNSAESNAAASRSSMNADTSTEGSLPGGVDLSYYFESSSEGECSSSSDRDYTSSSDRDEWYPSGGSSDEEGYRSQDSYDAFLSHAADQAARTVDIVSPSSMRRRAFATRAAAFAALGLIGASALIVSGGHTTSANGGVHGALGGLNALWKSEARYLREAFRIERQKKRRTSEGKCLVSAMPPPVRDQDLGEQLEAKFSCIGAAAMFPSELAYVHHPLVSESRVADAAKEGEKEEPSPAARRGWQLARTVESLFNITSALPELGAETFDSSKYRVHARAPLPAVGKCDDDGKHPSWFDPEVREAECASASSPHLDDRRPVFTADHCLDAFWCGLARKGPEATAAWRERALPSLREALYTSDLAKDIGDHSNADTGFHDDGSLHVVVHIQREGTEGKMEHDLGYYSKVIESLRAAAQSNTAVLVNPLAGIIEPGTTVKFFVHTDGDPRAVAAEMGVRGHPDVFVHGSGYPLPALVRRLVEADILVASSSPLVRSAALLRDNGRVMYPISEDHPGMVALGWKMMRIKEIGVRKDTGESVKVMQRLVEPWRGTGVNGGKWVSVDGEFWRDMLAHGVAKTVS